MLSIAAAPVDFARLARLPFAERVIKLGTDGRPLERDDEPHVAVYDPLLDLTWDRGHLADEEVTMARADELAAGHRLFGLDDWRLSDVFEGMSVVDRKRYNPAADAALLDFKSPWWYWTREVYAPDPAYRWCVNFNSGATNALGSYDAAFARAVRAGQPLGTRP